MIYDYRLPLGIIAGFIFGGGTAIIFCLPWIAHSLKRIADALEKKK